MALTIRVPGEIRGKGRPRFARTTTGVRTFTDDKTASAETWMRACAIEQVGQPCLDGPLTLAMKITVAVPASWSKRKRADALAGLIRPTGRPDLDNCAKLLDALNGLVWKDDSQIVSLFLAKRYGELPGAAIVVCAA
jgi:Holliday junction resolvase RusA-like endonuclease